VHLQERLVEIGLRVCTLGLKLPPCHLI
jgi:hypothetical protein